MMRSTLMTATAPLELPAATSGLLDIDAAEFSSRFNRGPFLIGHHLADHPLFELPRLLELARTLPEKNVEYNAGAVPVNCDPSKTPRNGLSIEETVRRIEECQSWMVLKYVDTDPSYRDVLHECLAEVRKHSEAIAPGMCQPEAFVFLTSPGSVTPYHMDPEHNFLLQIRGQKEMHVFDREVVSDEELERFYDGAHRNMSYKDEFSAREKVFQLTPGKGLHVPVCAPHWVKNGPEVSVSFSITFRTPDLDHRSLTYQVNGMLRRRGWKPTPVGRSPWRDRLKCSAYRMWRKARTVLGRR